jgi:hypothetical protein
MVFKREGVQCEVARLADEVFQVFGSEGGSVPTGTHGVSLYLDAASCNFLLDGDIIQGVYNNYTRHYLEYLKLFLVFEIIPLRRILVT